MLLYAWGPNQVGQLGLGFRSNSELTPRLVNLDLADFKAQDIVSISGGMGHTMILATRGRAFVCGWNSNGQLGMSEDFRLKIPFFTRIELLQDSHVSKIACGAYFSAAACRDGGLYMWGDNEFSQLGVPRGAPAEVPWYVDIPQVWTEGIKDVACGWRHTAILTKEERVITAGARNHGQLGLGHNFNPFKPMHLVPNLDEIKSISCGQYHTLALKQNGTVYAWGRNECGQLGYNRLSLPKSFVPLNAFHHEGLTSVHASYTHSAALSASGEVFTWGLPTAGQLGSQRPVPHVPTKVPSLSDVKQLSVGFANNLAVTGDKKLYSWGWNSYGSCGTGNRLDVTVPTQILCDKQVKSAFACSGGTSFAITY